MVDEPNEPQPEPLLIGGVPKPPLALLPDPVALFQGRARRFAFLAENHELAPYLRFLAGLSRLQARLAATLPPTQVPAEAAARAAQAHMPPIDRHALLDDPALATTLQALLDGAIALEMPEAARTALEAVLLADASDRRWLLGNVLGDDIPADSTAPHLFVAAAVQVHLARLAAGLDGDVLVPVATGVCPACGGRPATSSVMGMQGIENVRYASCAGCATQWNEVRVKCLCCGSTRGLAYRSVGTDEATVKAEACRECNAWVKIFYKVRNESLDPIADDVGSLGLDVLMKDAGVRRGGFNPYLVGW
ncbi:formate dehydrogenase accessory protein FdhE [Pseudoxanthomonas koreensis]|uniref:formate dehydrogenase accessory protein FdhE n=1 Tax=Pseudoxanthomonas koreensis TaxID=266061 RepID=UPI00139177D1|nr:formate dehydrogenase accessory protein FdhE [Pseudoxanthomonas koreensis]KAF1689886.1 formate dehydrogenase accessory protein FdhE [Pseudoxanthomonas koreensis]